MGTVRGLNGVLTEFPVRDDRVDDNLATRLAQRTRRIDPHPAQNATEAVGVHAGHQNRDVPLKEKVKLDITPA